MSRHLLVIGAQRCGTTYLHSRLDAHPQITMARPANPEPKVFCSDETAGRGAQWYRETYFAHARDELILGEKSTSYLEDPKAARRAADVLGGDVQVVAVLREPVRRAISNWQFSTDHGLETRSLESALRDNLAGPTPWDPERTSVSPFAYLERGRFHQYLQPWMTTFADKLHVLFLEEIVAQDHALDELWESLGVSSTLAPERSERRVNSSAGDPPGLTPELLGTLEAYFESSNRALGTQLGRKPPW